MAGQARGQRLVAQAGGVQGQVGAHLPDQDHHQDPVLGPDEYCYGDYDEDGYWDDTLGCEDYGYWDWKTTTKLNPGKRRITRINTVRVAKDETPGCVSRSEFRAVKDGMSQAKVHGIFGTTGLGRIRPDR